MFEHYLAALLSLGQDRDLAYSALPNAPVQPHREDRKAERNHRLQRVSIAGRHRRGGGACRSSRRRRAERILEVGPMPMPAPGVARGSRHGCVALVKELFPQLDRELDTWEAEYSWLYR